MELYQQYHQEIVESLNAFGFQLVTDEPTGLFFHDSAEETAILVDIGICSLADYPYISYTSRQNQLFHIYNKVFRFHFSVDSGCDDLTQEISLFLNRTESETALKIWGRNREEWDIDPTPPEAGFENAFIDAFGKKHLQALNREFEYYDLEHTRRFVDYALFSENQKFAIELNGERYHHPPFIGEKRYRSQLFKQNSLVADGFKVFRWSLRGMQDKERMILDLKTFLGKPDTFRNKSILKFDRAISTIDLYEHQADALTSIEQGRQVGKNCFLVVLPTGTGKTEIFIEDIARVQKGHSEFCALVLVPTRKLKKQTIDRFKARLPHLTATSDLQNDSKAKVVVQTSAYLCRHYFHIDPNFFDYIVVDEAHHAMASGLQKVIKHFSPQCLLGTTATPNRLDQKKLENIFGEYESTLSLEQAINRGLIPSVRCYRIESNIDLSEVRFNGRDYTAKDLQKTIIVPSRDILIAETLEKYFGGTMKDKQGVVFCSSIDHAKRMAQTLNDFGITALPVSGADRPGTDKAMELYNSEKIRFLCTCDLLTEGWDSPRTSILVMARPTFSQVLYTQQIGRGTRHYPGKEALYVLDMVDNYGAGFIPLSIHSLFGIENYCPFGDLVNLDHPQKDEEITILDGLYEGARKIIPVNIFNYEKIYGDYLNEEQLARELFVSTDTVKSWIRTGSIKPDQTIVFGRRSLNFFSPDRVQEIREVKSLSEHTKETRKTDFLEFIKTGDYTFSYKMIFILSFLKQMEKSGEAPLDGILEDYSNFYLRLLEREGKCDKKTSPYNRIEFLEDASQMKRSLLQNPFEKYERKRFLYHCKDLNYIGLDGILLKELESMDYSFVRENLVSDLVGYFKNVGLRIDENDFGFLLDAEY